MSSSVEFYGMMIIIKFVYNDMDCTHERSVYSNIIEDYAFWSIYDKRWFAVSWNTCTSPTCSGFYASSYPLSQVIRRRVLTYRCQSSIPAPNSLWWDKVIHLLLFISVRYFCRHIDGLHKLFCWKLVIHEVYNIYAVGVKINIIVIMVRYRVRGIYVI